MALKAHFRVHIVGPVGQLVTERGGSIEAVLRRSSMPADAHRQPWVEVPLECLHRFHEEAAAEIDEPLLGLKVGARLPPTTWDVIQLCARSAKNLGEALLRLPALIGLFNAWVEITVKPGAVWTVDHRISGEPKALSRHGNELWVATLLEQMKRVTKPVRPARVWFAHARPKVAKEVAKWFGVDEVSWGAGSSGIGVSEADAALPLLSADPVMFQALERLTSAVLKTTSPRKGVTALVHGTLREAINERVPEARVVAKALAMSERSLQRALHGEGTRSAHPCTLSWVMWETVGCASDILFWSSKFSGLNDRMRRLRDNPLRDYVPLREQITEEQMSQLEAFLKRVGWKPGANAWASRSGRQYRVVEEIAPGAWDRSAAPFLAKAILHARAGASPDVEVIAALKVKRATPLTDGRLATFVDEVAPGQGWILLDAEGRVFPHIASAPELADAAAKQVLQSSKAPAPIKQQSLFTDLNQWMLKVLLAPNLLEKYLNAPRGRAPRNASTLAEVANVSLAAATRFLHALDADGQLDTRFGDLRVARPLDLLPQWRDRMDHPARQEVGVTSVRGPFNLELLASGSRKYAKLSGGRAPLVLGLHAACVALELGHVSGAMPVVWTPSLDTARLDELGLIAVKAEQRIDLVLRVPRYPESLFRGVVSLPTSTVTDIIQCWLDTSKYRVRGQEQADFLWRRVLKPAFTRA